MRLLYLLLALACFVLAPVVLAEPAFAEPPLAENEGEDISAKIQEQMQKIIELMRKNEEALLELSTGGSARTEAVDVTPPQVPKTEGAGGGGKPTEGRASEEEAGRAAAEKLEKLLREQEKASEAIPDELEELVRMVPL